MLHELEFLLLQVLRLRFKSNFSNRGGLLDSIKTSF